MTPRTPFRTRVAFARAMVSGWIRAWFGLTRDEQKGLLIVLSLFLLGLAVRWWHLSRLAP
jgi:hypothetical protein